MIRIVILLLLFLFLSEIPAMSQPKPGNEEPVKFSPALMETFRTVAVANAKSALDNELLTGVKAVSLRIESLTPALAPFITEEYLRTAIELRCRSVGLKIVDAETGDQPFLYLAIGAVPVKDSGVAYNISLSLQDLVMPAKTLKHITCSSIWKGESIHYAPAMLATRENFKDKVLEDFDFFLNEWMKANRP